MREKVENLQTALCVTARNQTLWHKCKNLLVEEVYLIVQNWPLRKNSIP